MVDQHHIGPSPLAARVGDVARAWQLHLTARAAIGNNKATRRVMGAAEQLAELVGDIERRARDANGYPIEEDR